MNSKEIIKRLKADGWYLVRTRGSHHHFKHKTKKRITTVPHPKKEIPIKTVQNIEKQSGVKLL